MYDPQKRETLTWSATLAIDIEVNTATCLRLGFWLHTSHEAADRGRRGVHALATRHRVTATDLARRQQALRGLLSYIDVR